MCGRVASSTASHIGRPLKERPQVMSVRIKGSAAVSGEERSQGQIGLIERVGMRGSSEGQKRQIANSHHGSRQVLRRTTQQRLTSPAIWDTCAW